MSYLVIETFPQFEQAALVTNEDGKVKVFDKLNEAIDESEDCQDGLVVSTESFVFSNQKKKEIEEVFKQRCLNNDIKYKSKKYYELQTEFFSGAMAVYNEAIPSWSIMIMSGREIIEKY